ncbi:hypothetical protein [uncultured Hoeflea sp.]|uniref:hypothetical protein n=1 Tax=uncultured Hoeflea sp. TaxID=538666 RepID=UPI00261BAAF2|nr:hypothetical protein [uncultured Hoeflea sp.]
MRIVFDQGSLRLRVDDGAPLHADALETWRDADNLANICIDTLPPEEANAKCQELAEAATRALTLGRDDTVRSSFQGVKLAVRHADENLRMAILKDAIAIFGSSFAVGFAAGAIWMLVEPHAPWNSLPEGLDLAANYLLLVLGWAGFTLVGFSVGWLFLATAMVRIQDREGVVKQALTLRQRKAQFTYHALICCIIVIVMFFFDGFDKINETLAVQLTSAPWSVLLGLVAGVAEPALFERLRGFLKLS